ncbi:hypothetical protein VPHD479_0108 [Vibrio phage D479]
MIEIERKFLVADRSVDWSKLANYSVEIEQAYLTNDPERAVRVRIEAITGDDHLGTLTIKGKSYDGGLRRLEVEKPLYLGEARALQKMAMAEIEKTRHYINHEGTVWEVDVYRGELEGLVTAEVELETGLEDVTLPDWVGVEVTSDGRYSNQHLAFNPKFFG